METAETKQLPESASHDTSEELEAPEPRQSTKEKKEHLAREFAEKRRRILAECLLSYLQRHTDHDWLTCNLTVDRREATEKAKPGYVPPPQPQCCDLGRRPAQELYLENICRHVRGDQYGVEESGLSLVKRIFENRRERWYPNMKKDQFSNGLNEIDFRRACNSVTVNNGQLFCEEDIRFEFRRQVKERLTGTNLEQSLNVDKEMHRICHHGLTIEESYYRNSALSWGKIRDDPFLFYLESHPATGVSADGGKLDLPLHKNLVNDEGVAVLVPNVYLHIYFNYFDLARYLLEAENRCELPITPALVYNIFDGLQLNVLPRPGGCPKRRSIRLGG
jgi:hypothetical protein